MTDGLLATQVTSSPSMSFKILKRFLYGRNLQFEAGATTRPEVPQSSAVIVRTRKAQGMDQARANTKKHDELLWLLLQHLRDHLSASSWYSLPRAVLEELQIQKLGQALTSAFSQVALGDNLGALPLADARHFMPIQDLSRSSASNPELLDKDTSVPSRTSGTPFLTIEADDDGVVMQPRDRAAAPAGPSPDLVPRNTSLQDLVQQAAIRKP